MLAQGYPDFEVIAVDDRSTDDTLACMHSFLPDPRLKVLDIRELPAGWLGKNHALYQGYRVSSGEWLLFTDADVMFDPRALASAVSEIRARGLDHLTLFIRILAPDFLVSVFGNCFALAFLRRYRPWAASNPKSKAYIGVGAFNFLSRKAYEAFGTHKAMAMSVVDDMDLGRLVKQAGFRQMAAFAGDLVSVRWIESWKGILKSLEKNAFAGFNYSLGLLLLVTLAALVIDIAPFALPFVTHGAAFGLSLATLALIFCVYAVAGRWDRSFDLTFPFHAFGTVLIFLVCWRSAILALRHGGIRWRDTFYPLKDLTTNP